MTNEQAAGEREHLCLRPDCMNTRARLVQVNQKAENLNDWLDRTKQENSTLRQQLAAANARLGKAERFRFGSCLFSCSNNGWECYRLSDGSYLGDPPHSNTFIYKTFDAAYLAAVAANWIHGNRQEDK